MNTTVSQVMTTDVQCVSRESPFKEIARRMVSGRIGALPVLDVDGRLLGMVSESDLMLKETAGDRAFKRPFLGHVARRRRRKAVGRVAAELMTGPPITVGPDARLDQAARKMLRHGVKHLAVTDETGRLIGILSGSDLLKAYVRSDEQIEREVLATIEEVLAAGLVVVTVRGGVATLTGRVPWHRDADLCASVAGRTDGVVGIDNRLSFEADERALAYPAYWSFMG